MEYIAYSIFYFATLFFIIKPVDYNKTYFKIIWFSVAFFYSLSIRLDILSLVNGDLPNYIRIMQLDEISFNIPIFQREFIFFNLTRYLYNLFENPTIVFIILDLILYFFLYKSLSTFFNINCAKIKPKNFSYVFFLILLFFPFYFGMNNMYRQLFGIMFLLNSLNFIHLKKYYSGLFFFIISIFIHNSFLLFLPLIMLMFNNKFMNFISYLSLAFFAIIFTAVLQIEDGYINRGISLEIEIGENISQYIFYVLIIMSIIYQIIKSKVKFENNFFNNFLIINTAIYSVLMVNLSSLSSYRISLAIFFLLIPYFILLVENSFKQMILARIIFFHLSLFPLLIL